MTRYSKTTETEERDEFCVAAGESQRHKDKVLRVQVFNSAQRLALLDKASLAAN